MERPRLFLTIFVIVAFMTPIVAVSINETKVLVSDLTGYKSEVLVKLDIHIPREARGRCFVLVRRFPSMYNPTYDGYTEKVYVGVHRPGTVVEVEKVLNAYVAKSFEYLDPGGTKIYHYYEPQEFFVALLCKDGNTTTFKWSKIVQVYPTWIIYRRDVYPSRQSFMVDGDRGSAGVLQVPPRQFNCTVAQDEFRPGSYRRGGCVTWVRGPLLYSMWFVKTRYGVNSNYEPVALYTGAFGDLDAGPFVKPESQVDWIAAGKKLAASNVTMSTAFLSGPYSDRVYFKVKYVYEWGRECGVFPGKCYSYWLLYPSIVLGVYRSGQGLGSGIPNETSSYNPPTYCQYTCHPITSGTSCKVYFLGKDEGTDEYTPYQGDVPIAGTRVVFSLNGTWSAELNVNFYKAIRDDMEYRTPYVEIVNNRSSVVYWSYEQGDPSYPTLRLCCANTRPH